jgi:RNA polymerase sigma factor (sigma-70 family)
MHVMHRGTGMATATITDFMQRLTRQMGAASLGDHSDRDLVEKALSADREAALGAIVNRHGAMVYRVCFRVLQHGHDAEDAFQATFLVLAQKLHSIRKQPSLASWLHGVAHRVALRAKSQAATRRRFESEVLVRDTSPADDLTWKELRSALDAELCGLPEKLRQPLILCYLEGRTQDEAADALGWSKSTLRRRLSEARDALGQRLVSRGVALSAALSAILVSDCLASGAPAPALVAATVDAAASVAAGTTVTAAASAKVAALTKGVMKAMLLSQCKTVATVLVLTVGFLVGGGTMLRYQRLDAQEPIAAAEKRLGKAPVALPDGAQDGDKEKPQTIRPRDILLLTVTSADDPPVLKKALGGQRIVRPDGTVSLDQYGAVYVEKLTTERAGKAIEKHMAKPEYWQLPKVTVRVTIKGQTTDEIWRAVEDLEVAREKLRDANKIVDAARKKFLGARERLETVKRKGQPREPQIKEGLLVKIDAGDRTLRLELWHESYEPEHEILGQQILGVHTIVYENFTVKLDAVIVQDNVPAKLWDLRKGSHVSLQFDTAGKTVERIAADGGTVEARFVSANEARNTIDVSAGEKPARKVYHLVKETVAVTASGKAILVKDIPKDAQLLLTRSVQDANTVIRIEARMPEKE